MPTPVEQPPALREPERLPSPVPEEHADRRAMAQVILGLGSTVVAAALGASIKDAPGALVGSLAGMGAGLMAAAAIVFNGLAMRRAFRAAAGEQARADTALSEARTREAVADERVAAADRRAAEAAVKVAHAEAALQQVKQESATSVGRAWKEREAALDAEAVAKNELAARRATERGWLVRGDTLSLRLDKGLIDVAKNLITFDVLIQSLGEEFVEATELVLHGVNVNEIGVADRGAGCLDDPSLAGRKWRRCSNQWATFSFAITPEPGRMKLSSEGVARLGWGGGTYALRLPSGEELKATIRSASVPVLVKPRPRKPVELRPAKVSPPTRRR
jgi:hypothetical protein